MATVYESFTHWSLTDLIEERDLVKAEIRRILLAGQSFGDGLGRTRTGVRLDELIRYRNALEEAIAENNGSVITETVADLSAPPI